ncbi:MAG: B12-binding domain-containing radical SAM protein [Chloroflexota bacterium]
MNQKVTFVDLTIEEATLPLVAGYLQAYACKDATVANAYDFDTYSTTVRTAAGTIIRDLINQESDIYAFSGYVWNTGLMRSVLPSLMDAHPNAQYILGGPQVMHQAHKYLDAERENLVLCNGEGERTFYEYLLAQTERVPDLSKVNGLSFYRDKTLMTTAPQTRIKDLEDIPSPFLSNALPDRTYLYSPYETNRGCPFRCGFCFWGAATNDRVYQFDEQRVRQEVEWIGRKGIAYIFVADSNWGMLRRDIPLSQHIADTSKKHGAPMIVQYSSSKNKPEKSMEITKIFYDAGIITSQSLSMQTMSPDSLAQIDRQNIRLSAYMNVQQQLRESAISSFIELIWPLPGETLDSFKEGINTLCAARASAINVYPHMLLNNTPLANEQEKYGLVTKAVDQGVSEQEIVIQTSDVSYEDYQAGVHFYFSSHILHNVPTLTATADYLDKYAGVSYRDLFSAFSDFLRRQADSPIAQFVQQTTEETDYFPWLGKIVHYTLHGYRQHFGELLYAFVSSQPWWSDANARTLFEVDLLAQPYIYSDTPFTQTGYTLQELALDQITERGYVVRLSDEQYTLLDEFVSLPENTAHNRLLHIDHSQPKGQIPSFDARGIDVVGDYCYSLLMRIDDFVPQLAEQTEMVEMVSGEI